MVSLESRIGSTGIDRMGWGTRGVNQFSSVQSLSCVRLFAIPWTAACQASLSITSSWSLFKLMSIETVMPSNHLILCCPLLLLASIFPNIRVFSKESVLRWPKIWSFSFSIRPFNEYSGLISFRMNWLDLLAVQGTLKSLHGQGHIPGMWGMSTQCGGGMLVMGWQDVEPWAETRKEEEEDRLLQPLRCPA